MHHSISRRYEEMFPDFYFSEFENSCYCKDSNKRRNKCTKDLTYSLQESPEALESTQNMNV